jgi:hypothetical protein
LLTSSACTSSAICTCTHIRNELIARHHVLLASYSASGQHQGCCCLQAHMPGTHTALRYPCQMLCYIKLDSSRTAMLKQDDKPCKHPPPCPA